MPAAKPILLSWSGGKDSLMALDRLLADPQWKVTGLLSTLDRASDRVAMHDVRADVIRAQAGALKLPLIEMAIDWPAPNDAYEAALARALNEARVNSPGLQHVAFGDLHLADIRAWREATLQRLGWCAVFPLWNEAARELAASFITRGHRAVVTTVDLDQLDAAFCGREFDTRFLGDLPEGVDACGENGEFHTLCIASPLFDHPLRLLRGDAATRDGRFARVDFLSA